jgi:small conductance mechanosensitive channel
VVSALLLAPASGSGEAAPPPFQPPGGVPQQVGSPADAGQADTLPDASADAHVLREESQAALARQAPVRELLAVYRRIDGLRDVRIHLEDGVLELSGTALAAEDRTLAAELARGIPGVVWVDNRIAVETDVRKRLAPTWERMEEKGVAFLRFLPSLVLGLLLAGASILLAVWMGNRSFPFDRIAPNAFARNLLRQVIRTVIVLGGVLLALDLMAATALVGAVLGAAGLLGIAVGFAFRDIVENYLAGVLLSLRQPFAPNDHLQMAGHEGRVVRLTGRETILMTLDGNHVRIPNATVYKEVITNFTRNPRRRFLISASVAPWEELGRALALARSAVAGVPGVLEDPRPAVRVQELGDSAVELRVTGWVDQRAADFSKVRSQALRAVKEAFEGEGVATPPPEYGIRILEGPPSAGEPTRPSRGTAEPTPGLPDDTRGAAPGRGAGAPSAPPPTAEEGPLDVSPDTTIEDEIARELATSGEENLLRPPPTSLGGPPPPPGG